MNERLFWSINSLAGGWGDIPMIAFTATGYSMPAITLGLAAIYLYRGFYRKNLMLFAIALIVGGGAVHVIKQAYSTPRPLKYYSRTTPKIDDKINAPFTKLRARSFPSGHSQTAFTVATFIALLFRRHIAIWFGWAFVVAISRVYLGLHFPVDIIAGSFLGAFIAFITLKLGNKSEKIDGETVSEQGK